MDIDLVQNENESDVRDDKGHRKGRKMRDKLAPN